MKDSNSVSNIFRCLFRASLVRVEIGNTWNNFCHFGLKNQTFPQLFPSINSLLISKSPRPAGNFNGRQTTLTGDIGTILRSICIFSTLTELICD